MSGYEVVWNGVSSTTIPELVCGKITRRLLGDHRGSLVSIPGRSGAWFFPEERGRRIITIECFIEAESGSFPTGRRDAVTAVADWLDINTQSVLILGDQPDVFYRAILTDPPDVDEWRDLGVFTLEFSAEPYSFDLSPTSYLWSATNTVDLVHDFDLTSTVFPVIEVTPTNGASITGFTLTVNDVALVYANPVAVSTTVTINAIAMAIMAGTSEDINLTGAYDPIDLIMTNVSGVFPYLLKGSNTLDITKLGGDSTTFDVNIIYRKQYRK